MGDLQGNLGRPRHVENLSNGLEKSIPFAAHVAGEDALLLPRRPGQGDKLLRAGETGRGVDEPGGKAQGAIPHPLPDRGDHRTELLTSRRSSRPAHDRAPDGVVAQEETEVDRRRLGGAGGGTLPDALPSGVKPAEVAG